MKIGTNYSRMSQEITKREYRQNFMAGHLSPDAYITRLMQDREELMGKEFTLDDLYLTSRTPLDEKAMIKAELEKLVVNGVLPTASYPEDTFEEVRKLNRKTYQHDTYQTYIFPEEERMAFAVSSILKPQSICALGSYYGYWTSWAAPLYDKKASITLIDPDPKVLALAERNFKALGIADSAKFVCEDGVAYLARNKEKYDFFMLDAECPADHPNIEYRGKGVYGPLARAATERADEGAVLIAHNIMIERVSTMPYFLQKGAKNGEVLKPFVDLMGAKWGGLTEIGTTEGVGVAGPVRRGMTPMTRGVCGEHKL